MHIGLCVLLEQTITLKGSPQGPSRTKLSMADFPFQMSVLFFIPSMLLLPGKQIHVKYKFDF